MRDDLLWVIVLVFSVIYPNQNSISARNQFPKPKTAICDLTKRWATSVIDRGVNIRFPPSKFWVYFAASSCMAFLWTSFSSLEELNSCPFIRWWFHQTAAQALQLPGSGFWDLPTIEEKGQLTSVWTSPWPPTSPFPLKHTLTYSVHPPPPTPPHYIKPWIGPNRHFSRPMN